MKTDVPDVLEFKKKIKNVNMNQILSSNICNGNLENHHYKSDFAHQYM